MKITQLLNVPATAAVRTGGDGGGDAEMRDASQQSHPLANGHAPQRRMDMASLDLFAQQKQPPRDVQRSKVQDLSMNRIIQELHSGHQQKPPIAPTTRKDDASAIAASAMLSFTQQQQHADVSKTTQRPGAAGKTTIRKQKQPARPSIPKPPAPPADTVVAAEADGAEDQDDEAGAQRRRTRNGFAPLTESEKRVKQRQLVKRSYYRKIDTIKELREVAEKLEDEFQAVLDGRRKYSAQHQLELSPFEALREKYTLLAISKDDLRMENEALRSVAAEQSKARTRVGILLDEELREQEEVARIAGLPSPSTAAEAGESSENPENDGELVKPVIAIKPITQSECMEIVKEAYTHVMAFRDAQNYETTGASVFGWRDRRKVEDDTMKFFLEKTFAFPAEHVATTMWGILSTEEGVNRIYNSDIAIKFHLVQRVDDNNVVFYRTIEREGQGVVIKSLVLGSLVQIDTGFMLLFRSLDPSQRLLKSKNANSSSSSSLSPFSREKREVWSEVFSWGLYEHAGEHQEHCRNSFGGFVPSSTATTLEFWLMHILLIAVRCENEVIGPVFVLQ